MLAIISVGCMASDSWASRWRAAGTPWLGIYNSGGASLCMSGSVQLQALSSQIRGLQRALIFCGRGYSERRRAGAQVREDTGKTPVRQNTSMFLLCAVCPMLAAVAGDTPYHRTSTLF